MADSIFDGLEIEAPDENDGKLDLSGIEIEVEGEGSSDKTVASSETEEATSEPKPLDRFLDATGNLKEDFIPTTDMYDDLTIEQADALYEKIKSDERFVDNDPTPGNFVAENVPMYYNEFRAKNGKKYNVLPPVESLFGDTAKTSPLDQVAGGVQQGMGNLIKTGGALLDKAGRAMGLQEEDGSAITEYLDGALPNIAAGDDIWQNLKVGGGEFAPSLLLVTKAFKGIDLVAGKAPKAVSSVTPEFTKKLLEGVAKYTTAEAAFAAGSPTEGGTLVVGPSALSKNLGFYIDGVEVSDTDKASAILQQRTNVLLDGLMTSGVTDKVVKVGVKIASLPVNLLRPVFDMMNDGKRKQAIVDNILEQVAIVSGKVDENGNVVKLSGEELEREKARLVQMIEENKDVLVEIGDGFDDIAIKFDTATAMQRGMGDDEASKAAAAKISGIRQGAIQADGTGGAIDIATNRPLSAVDDLTAARSGTVDQIDEAADTVRTEGQQVMADMDAPVAAKQAELDAANTSLPDLLRTDLEFGAKVDELSRKTGINIGGTNKGAAKDVVANVEQAYVTLRDRKNELYQAIPDADLDVDNLINTFAGMDRDSLSALRNAVGDDSSALKVMRLMSPKSVPVTDAAGKPVVVDGVEQFRQETLEEVAARLPTELTENGINFKTLYNEIRPELSQAASDLFEGTVGDKRTARRLREFIGWIDSVPVVQGANEAADKARLEALNFYKNDYAPYFAGDPKTNPLTRIADQYDATVGRTSPADVASGAPRMRETDFQTNAAKEVRNITNDSEDAYINDLVSLLSREDVGADPKSVYRFMVADTLDKLEASVRLKGVDAPDSVNLINSLQRYGSKIAETFPEEAGRIGKMIDTIQAAKGDTKRLEAELAQISDMSKRQKDDFYNTTLKAFFQSNGLPAENGYAVFEKLLTDKQGRTQLDSLVELAGNSKQGAVILDGMKAAYNRFLRDKMLTAGGGPGGVRDLKLGPFFKETENVTDILEKGRRIYGNDSPYINAVEALLEMSGAIATNKRARSIPGASTTAPLQEAKKSIDRFITTLIGPLSRTGARARVLGGKIAESMDKAMGSNRQNEILAEVLSNPDEFIRIYREYETQGKRYTSGVVDSMFQLVKRAGIYGDNDYEAYVMDIMEAELQPEDNTETAIPVQ